jgi:hypothetical protein
MAESLKIDFTKIEFPSDGLTIKVLRRVHRDQIDAERLPTFFTDRERGGSAEDVLTDLLYCERALAEAAFDRHLGRLPADPLGVEGFAEELTRLYVRYGIASGEHHAEQLIRSFESHAIAQAREHSGRQP